MVNMLISLQGTPDQRLGNGTMLVPPVELSIGVSLDRGKSTQLRITIVFAPHLEWRHVVGVAVAAHPLGMHTAVALTAFLGGLFATGVLADFWGLTSGSLPGRAKFACKAFA